MPEVQSEQSKQEAFSKDKIIKILEKEGCVFHEKKASKMASYLEMTSEERVTLAREMEKSIVEVLGLFSEEEVVF